MNVSNINSSFNTSGFSHDPQEAGPFVKSIRNVAKYSPSLVVSLLAANTVMEVFTILGNLIVILTVVAYRQLWVPTNIMVASLAVVDFLIGLILQTSNELGLIIGLTDLKGPCTADNKSFCAIIFDSTGVVTVMVSLTHLSLITLDRFAAIVYPLRYATIITMSRTKYAVLLTWVLGVVFGLLASIPSPVKDGIRTMWNLYMLVTCVFMISLYGKLYCIASKHAKRIKTEIQSITPGAQTKEERRGLTTVAIVTAAMVSSYVPTFALRIDTALASRDREETAQLAHDILKQFAFLLILFNSTLNPLVYFFRSEKLRTYSLKLFKSIPSRMQSCF